MYTVSFFGHRFIEDHALVSKLLDKVIEQIIINHTDVEFLVGRNGEFDIIAASAVKTASKKLNRTDCYLTLVLPYPTADFINNEKHYTDYYDEIEVYPLSSKTHPKAVIQKRNRYMAERSNIVICYVANDNGGAASTVKYAKKITTVINIALPNCIDSILKS